MALGCARLSVGAYTLLAPCSSITVDTRRGGLLISTPLQQTKFGEGLGYEVIGRSSGPSLPVGHHKSGSGKRGASKAIPYWLHDLKESWRTARMKKKTINSFVLLLMSIFVPSFAQAEDYTWNDNGDGTCSITGYIGTGGDITVSNILNGLTVIAIGDGAFYNTTNLTGITIPDSITTIGSSAFIGCPSLTGVTVGNGVTAIGDGAFYKCSSLASMTILGNVTVIGSEVFSGCTGLTNITFGDSVTIISGQWNFYLCTNLADVTLGSSVSAIPLSFPLA